jgi:hypothetical protein
MAVFTVTHKQLTDNYAVLQLLTPTDIAVGQSITVAGVGAPFNGTFTVYDWLGIGTASALDAAFLTSCASAANQFCYRRRQEANYFDSLSTSPSGDVTLGTIMYGGALYRQRGSVDSFASFDNMQSAPPVALSGMVKQLLGIDRPAVA